jgi:ribosome-associated protein
MRKKTDSTEILIESIVKGIFEKKGEDVLKIDLRKLENRVTDYFIICQAPSKTQVDSSSVEDVVRKDAGERAIHVEGLENCFWVLIDYGEVIVHIFQEEYRKFYSLESLWADAIITVLKDSKK